MHGPAGYKVLKPRYTKNMGFTSDKVEYSGFYNTYKEIYPKEKS